MKESDEPAFADAGESIDEELPRRELSSFLLGDTADPLEEGEDALAIASVRASSVVGFSVNTCTVPLALETANQRRFGWKARLYISARSAPRRSSCNFVPSAVLNIRTRVPLLLAVAKRAPSRESDRQANEESCACTNLVFFALYSSIRTSPFR